MRWFPNNKGLVNGIIVGGFGLTQVQTRYLNPHNKTCAGEQGLVPRNYVQVVVDESLLNHQKINGPSSDGAMTHVMLANELATMTLGATGGAGQGNVDSQPWYFGNITRSQCDRMLNDFGVDGDFLIRESETNVGDYSVSLKAPVRNKHFRVHVEDGVYCIGQRRFNTLEDLVEHYKRAPIYTSPKGEKMYLVKSFQRL
uniref:SH2 domain-containing protein n=1 Tax=Strigamia maritima TaxID=126957 RepID=T1IUU8_STRMM